jgi:hypothetical protein
MCPPWPTLAGVVTTQPLATRSRAGLAAVLLAVVMPAQPWPASAAVCPATALSGVEPEALRPTRFVVAFATLPLPLEERQPLWSAPLCHHRNCRSRLVRRARRLRRPLYPLGFCRTWVGW